MMQVRIWISRLLDVVFRRRRDDRLDEEIASHLHLLEAELVAKGASRQEARRAARRAFGRVDSIKDEYRDRRGFPGADALAQDARFAVRLLRRDPSFTLAAVAVLGLGIGVNSMLFTIVNAHAIRGLPIRDAGHVLYLTTADDRRPDLNVSLPDFNDWRAGATSFESLAAFTMEAAVVSGDGGLPERVPSTFVSSAAFQIVGAQPALGRAFTELDYEPGAPAVVVVGETLWKTRYASDASILGRAVTVNGTPSVIVGVMPQRIGFPSTGELWIPLAQHPMSQRQERQARSLVVIGRLAHSRDIGQARAEIETVSARLAVEHPETNKRVRALVMPINQEFVANVRNPAWLAFMAVGMLVVVISSANAANLMLSRGLTRVREIALRRALGASRGRIVRQLCMEGAAIAALSAAAGLGLAAIGVRAFRAGIPANALPYWMEYSIDVRVLAALVIVSSATVLVFALLPALQCSKPDLNLELKDGGRTAINRKASRWTTIFLAAEFGLAVVLLAHFAVNLRIARRALPSDVSLPSAPVLTAEVDLPRADYASPAQRTAFLSTLRQRIDGLDGIEAVSLAAALPMNGGESRKLTIIDRPLPDKGQEPTTLTVAIAPDYFATLGLPLIRGREFSEEDGSNGRQVAIVNERFVERFMADSDPIGEKISVAATTGSAPVEWLTIAGVAPSIRQRPTSEPEPVVYLPLLAMSPAKTALLVRSGLDRTILTDRLRQELFALDRNLPLNRVRTMKQALLDADWVGRVSRNLADVLALIAVLLAAFGLYAVTSYAVSQRAQEIGVRMALGASRWQVVRFVGRRIVFQLSVGVATGLVLTRVWDAMFSSGNPTITASDPRSLLTVAGILVAVAVLACAMPVRRAMRLDPLIALRRD